MTDVSFSDRIAQLEAQIGDFATSIEKCRQAMLIAKVVGALGALWLAATMVGAVRFSAPSMVVSLSAVIGSFVVYGSSRSTSLQAAAAIEKAEAERVALIGTLDLRAVEQAPAPTPSALLH
jgi:hypothetical protein